MRIITAEIINKMSSPEGDSPEFDILWNGKLEELEANFSEIKDRLPATAVSFYDKYNLAGCAVFARAHNWETEEYQFVIGKPAEQKIVFVGYNLTSNPEIDMFHGEGFGTQEPAMWLYDEFHLKKNYAEHHVVFSDGLSYIMPFNSMLVRECNFFD